MSKIHPTAIIHPGAELDSSVEVGPWCTVGSNVKLGKGTRLVSHAVVDGWTTMGEDNLVFPFAVLGAIPQDLKYKGERTELIIGNRNTFREASTVNLGTVQGGGKTQLGDQNLVMAYVHFGHDCIVGNHCIFANYAGLAGHVTVEDFVTIGGQTGVGQFVRVGAHAYVGGQAGVEKDVPPFSISLGSRPYHLKGTNIIGLKRRGFPTEKISKINEAMKVWMNHDLTKEDALRQMGEQFGEIAEVQTLVRFIQTSETGVAR